MSNRYKHAHFTRGERTIVEYSLRGFIQRAERWVRERAENGQPTTTISSNDKHHPQWLTVARAALAKMEASMRPSMVDKLIAEQHCCRHCGDLLPGAWYFNRDGCTNPDGTGHEMPWEWEYG